jgi:hypothetical protein
MTETDRKLKQRGDSAGEETPCAMADVRLRGSAAPIRSNGIRTERSRRQAAAPDAFRTQMLNFGHIVISRGKTLPFLTAQRKRTNNNNIRHHRDLSASLRRTRSKPTSTSPISSQFLLGRRCQTVEANSDLPARSVRGSLSLPAVRPSPCIGGYGVVAYDAQRSFMPAVLPSRLCLSF